VTGRMTIGRRQQDVGRKTIGRQDGNLWTEIRGRKSRDESSTDGNLWTEIQLTSDVQSLAAAAAMAGSGAAPRNVTLRRWMGNVELQQR